MEKDADRVAQMLSWTGIAQRTIAVYESLLQRYHE
jgi:hypothetical protein